MAKKLLPVAIIAAAIALTVVLVRTRPPAEQADVVQPTTLVEVMSVRPIDTHISVASQGTVEPRTRTTLVSEVAGQVMEVSPDFEAGGFFHQGEVLLRLDDQDYRAAAARAEASVAAARSQLAQERGQADVAQREWDRMSQQQRDSVRARELYLRKPQLREAEAQLASAEADLEQARADLAKTTIVAPYDGLVSSKNTDIGQFVNTGATLAEIFAVDYAEVRLPIPEAKLPFLDLPSSVRRERRGVDGKSPETELEPQPEVELVSRLGSGEHRWTGRLVRTEGVLDTRTRVLFSVVRIEDPYNLEQDRAQPLRVGTYVNAKIQGRLLQDVVVLPRHTLRADDMVWVADPEDRLRSRQVDVVTVNGDNAYIAGGLEPGDRVVLTRLENPLNGSPVETASLGDQPID